jgi:hypothetical protein
MKIEVCGGAGGGRVGVPVAGPRVLQSSGQSANETVTVGETKCSPAVPAVVGTAGENARRGKSGGQMFPYLLTTTVHTQVWSPPTTCHPQG